MRLSERKKKILQLVVDDYIDTAVPVSSKSLTEKHLQNISSATVRSELSALEELGYLTQLHTSSGRVPSNEAYKLYVSELMVKDRLSPKEISYIKKIFTEKTEDLEYVVKNAVKVISELTDYTSVGLSRNDTNERIINIKLFRYRSDSALVLIVTDNKLLKDSYIHIPDSMTDEQLETASGMLAKVFEGKTISELDRLPAEIDTQFAEYKQVFYDVLNALHEYFEASADNIILEGEDKILNHPEYADVDRIKNFLSVVTSKDKMVNMLSDDGRGVKINVKIGKDGYDGMPEDCSVVTATYSVNGSDLGTYGVIGPCRMDYQKVFAVLENVGRILETLLSEKK